jgi:hypothetical protein
MAGDAHMGVGEFSEPVVAMLRFEFQCSPVGEVSPLRWPLERIIPPGKIIALVGSEWLGDIFFVAIFLALSYGVALLSWHTYEKHWLKLRARFDYKA